ASFYHSPPRLAPHSSPTRRSSDLSTSCYPESRTSAARRGPSPRSSHPRPEDSADPTTSRKATRAPSTDAAGSSNSTDRGCEDRRSEEHTSELQSRGHTVWRLPPQK